MVWSDCYYFLYSKCMREDQCMYRHSPQAKMAAEICESWASCRPCPQDCPFRHSDYHLKKSRGDTECFWENKGGCKKPECPYKHALSSGSQSIDYEKNQYYEPYEDVSMDVTEKFPKSLGELEQEMDELNSLLERRHAL